MNFLGCKTKEEKFIEKHEVMLYNSVQYNNFIKNVKISINDALKIANNYSKNNNIENMDKMFFVIDKYYVFTCYFHAKIPDASTKGIWVDVNTGEVEYHNSGIFLRAYEYYK